MTMPLWCLAAFSDDDEGRPRRGHIRAVPSVDSTDDTLDRALIARIRDGDWDAIRDTFDAYYDMLIRFGTRISGSRDEAEDAVQEVFLRVWDGRATLRPTSTLRAYFIRAIRNRLINTSKHHQTAHRLEQRAGPHDVRMHSGSAAPSPHTAAEWSEIQGRMRSALDALPSRQRDAMLLRWREEMTPREIAEALEISDRVARKLLAAAAAKLRRVFEDLA